jgi:hypothetical protein
MARVIAFFLPVHARRRSDALAGVEQRRRPRRQLYMMKLKYERVQA